MLAGATTLIKATQDRDIGNNKVDQLVLVYHAVKEKPKKMASLISNFAKLKQMTHWCSRYKVELLSKDYDRSGKYIASHIIPFCVQGFNDQNVLLQVLLGGENNKIVNMLQVKEYQADIPTSNEFGYTA